MALISSVFSCFFCKREKPAARGRTRGSRNKKPGAACRPGSWRGFGEYIFLEDSRYASQAENRAAIKSFNRRRKSAHAARPAHPVSCSPSMSACDRLRARRTPMKSFVIAGLLAAVMIGRAKAAVYDTFPDVDWDRLTHQAPTMYIAGAYDSLVSITSADTAAISRHYSKCVSGRIPIEQLAKNVRTFVAARPDLQKKPVQVGLINYLIEHCGPPPN